MWPCGALVSLAGTQHARSYSSPVLLGFFKHAACVLFRLLFSAVQSTCVGHILAFAVLPYGFPYYFGGAVALEFGSALYNLYCLYPSARGMAWSFLAAMTISNTVHSPSYLLNRHTLACVAPPSCPPPLLASPQVAACFCCTWLMLDFPIPAKVRHELESSLCH